ncbi:MAG TPA: hypothetical protein PL110_20350 [Candidatus Eremiobacteraeota bacterium]|nr:hypothetical protein [Candidatus Eremiobacteraeota bacterium]
MKGLGEGIEKRKVLLKYIKNNKEAIYGTKKLEGKIPTDQLVVGHRMKR